MARERSNQICVILDNAVINTLNDEVERTKSSRSSVVARWINSYFHLERSLKEHKSQIGQLHQDIEVLQAEKSDLQEEIQNRHEQLRDLQHLGEDRERLKSELQNRDEEIKDLRGKVQDLNQVKIQIEKLQVELSAKDNDIKRLEDNLGYLRLEHSKLREEVAAPLTRLLTAAAEEDKVKKWWQFWKREVTGSQK